MNTSVTRKRNRSDNFDVDDVEILLGLVNEHSDMLDSIKPETKKEGKRLLIYQLIDYRNLYQLLFFYHRMGYYMHQV